MRHVAVLTTWSEADLGSERNESDDLEQNHQHLDSDRDEAGTKMGKCEKTGRDLHPFEPLFNNASPLRTSRRCIDHVVLGRFEVRKWRK